jgi:hypothetical protein
MSGLPNTIWELGKLASELAEGDMDPLTPAWAALLATFYGAALTPRTAARVAQLTNRPAASLLVARPPMRELWVRAGRRGRKSSTAALLIVHELLHGGHEEHLIPGERGLADVISCDLASAHRVLAFASIYLRTLGVAHHDSSIGSMKIIALDALPFDIGALACTSRTPRSHPSPVAVCDEITTWAASEEYAHPDREILAVLRPAMAQFPNAKLVAISSAFTKEGVHFNTIEQHLAEPTDPNVLVAHGATWIWNPSITRERTRQLERDHRTWLREYGAEPQNAIVEGWFAPDSIERCRDARRPASTLRPRIDGASYVLGIDAAFSGDRFAVAVVHGERIEGSTATIAVVDHVRVWSAPRGGTLSPEVVIPQVAAIARLYRAQALADQFAFQPIATLFRQHNVSLQQVPWTTSSKPTMFRLVRDAMIDGRVRLPDDQPTVDEFCNIRGTLRAGSESIGAGHGHDDRVSAIVLACALVLRRGGGPIIGTSAEAAARATAVANEQLAADLRDLVLHGPAGARGTPFHDGGRIGGGRRGMSSGGF